jgi:hypothetical protein
MSIGLTKVGLLDAHGRLAGDEGCTAGGAALPAVPVGEHSAFSGDAVDIRRFVAWRSSWVKLGQAGTDP